MRFGIGRPPGRMDGAAFVLGTFTSAEWQEVPTICEQAADATELLVDARTGACAEHRARLGLAPQPKTATAAT